MSQGGIRDIWEVKSPPLGGGGPILEIWIEQVLVIQNWRRRSAGHHREVMLLSWL